MSANWGNACTDQKDQYGSHEYLLSVNHTFAVFAVAGVACVAHASATGGAFGRRQQIRASGVGVARIRVACVDICAQNM